jgi:AP-2 complex subunit mu-1
LQIIASKATGQTAPVILVEGVSFLYVRHKDLYLVAATTGNPNAAMLFEYLLQKIRIVKAYLGEKFNDETLHANFTLIYELFDETMDYGYPQNCTVDVLKLYINQGDVRQNLQALQTGAQLTSQITGAIDWRREGIRYRSNEVYIDVQETVTLLASTTGAVLRGEVHGKVMMKTLLTGMPECKFGLNDKLIMEKEGGAAAAAGQLAAGVEIDDCTFHRYELCCACILPPRVLSAWKRVFDGSVFACFFFILQMCASGQVRLGAHNYVYPS